MTGYQSQLVMREYAEAMVDWQASQSQLGGYDWTVDAADVFTVPDVMKGVDLAIRFFSAPEDPVVIPMPVYMPFFDVVTLTRRPQMKVPMGWDGTRPVSYTHLDVYKRQAPGRGRARGGGRTAYGMP